MTKHGNPPRIPLPSGWSLHARSAMLHVISLAQFALAYTRGWAVNSCAGPPISSPGRFCPKHQPSRCLFYQRRRIGCKLNKDALRGQLCVSRIG